MRSLSELVATAPSKKVVRVSVAALRNLAASENDAVLTEMLTHGLQKTLENIIATNVHKQYGDVEVRYCISLLFKVRLIGRILIIIPISLFLLTN